MNILSAVKFDIATRDHGINSRASHSGGFCCTALSRLMSSRPLPRQVPPVAFESSGHKLITS